MINNRFNVVYHLLCSVFIHKFVLMRELDNNLMCKIFKKINSDKHKILKVKKIIESIEENKICNVYLFDDIFLETKKEDYYEIIEKYFPTLLENEEYEICHKLKQLKLV
jgi:hypothetical protein